MRKNGSKTSVAVLVSLVVMLCSFNCFAAEGSGSVEFALPKAMNPNYEIYYAKKYATKGDVVERYKNVIGSFVVANDRVVEYVWVEEWRDAIFRVHSVIDFGKQIASVCLIADPQNPKHIEMAHMAIKVIEFHKLPTLFRMVEDERGK